MSDIKVVSIQNDDAPFYVGITSSVESAPVDIHVSDAPFYMDVNSSDEVIPIDLHVLIGGKGDPGPAGQGFPAGGVAGQVLMKIDAVDYNTEWSDIGYLNDNPVPTDIGGITTGTSFPTSTPISDVLTQLLYPYIPPSVSIGTNVVGLHERGVEVPSATFTINVTRRSKPIQSVELSRWDTSIYTAPDATLPQHIVPDGSPFSNTTHWTARVSDGTQTSSASTSVTFVDPYFIGVRSNRDTYDEIGLAKRLTSSSSITWTFVESGYITLIVPPAFGSLRSIIDQNGFNVTEGYDVTDTAIMLASGSTTCKLIRKKEPAVISTTFSLTFNF